MTWRERLEGWLVSDEVKKAVKDNEEAHKRLQRALSDCVEPGLKGVDALLKGEKENATA